MGMRQDTIQSCTSNYATLTAGTAYRLLSSFLESMAQGLEAHLLDRYSNDSCPSGRRYARRVDVKAFVRLSDCNLESKGPGFEVVRTAKKLFLAS
jgi:hypothetical protein